MNEAEQISDLSARAFQRACTVYDSLAETVASAIRKLKERDAAAAAMSKEEVEALRTHQKVLVMVLDFEAQLIKRERAGPRGADAPVDLDAAREEVARRLDRIAALGDP